MQLTENISLFSPNYGTLTRRAQNEGLEFDNIIYSLDLHNGNLENFNTIVFEDSICTEFINSNYYDTTTWLTGDNIDTQIIKNVFGDTLHYHKASCIGDYIGDLVYIGKNVYKEYFIYKAIYENISLTKALKYLNYPNKEKIIPFIKDTLNRPNIKLGIEIPYRGYEVDTISIICSYPQYDTGSFFTMLRKNNLLSLNNYNKFLNMEWYSLNIESFELVYYKGKLQTCKLYLSLNNKLNN